MRLISCIISVSSSTVTTDYQNISDPSTTSTLPDLPDPDDTTPPPYTCTPNPTASSSLDQGMGYLKLWSQLPEILNEDGKEVVKVKGKGYCLIESIVEALAQDYDIFYSTDEIIEYISKELIDKPDYTRYLRQPITQDVVDFNLLNMTTSKTYSRVVTDMYLPSISSALDLHIKTIQNISGYYGVVNTLPINTIDEAAKKTITLIIENGIYQPVVDKKCATPPPALPNLHQSPVFRIQQSSDYIVISSDSSEPCSPIASPINIQPQEDSFLALTNEADQLLARLKKEPEEEEIPNIEWEHGLLRSESRRLKMDMTLFKGMVPDVVNKIPYNINGTKYYMIDVPEEETFFSKYRDGRYFDLNTSTRKGFRGVRRIGKCRGNYVCSNPSCPYLLQQNSKNQHQFTTIGRNKFCFSCNCIVYREPCGAIKLIEYHINQRVLEVYHVGEHSCHLKPDTKQNDSVIQESVMKYGANITPKDMAKMKMTEELKSQFNTGELDMDKIIDIGSQFTNRKRINQIKSRMQNQMKSEKHSLAAVAEYKSCTDTSDIYLIYKIHDANMSGTGQSFVFKSSRRMANLCLNMDQNNPVQNPLMSEPAYFDGMHKRCQGWKTLTLWVYHPASRKLMRLATMEVQGETSESTALFWENLNSMLREVKQDEGISFNPSLFITDEAGANFNGIRKVFGEDGVKKTRTCQFHYKQSLHRMLTKFPPDLYDVRNEFEELMTQLLTVTTLNEFHELKNRIVQLCALLPSLEHGVNWWFARRYHLFPIFRGYCISSVNMAEIGHSTLKKKKPLALVDACWEDVCSMIMQEQEHTKFLAGRGFSSGKGPSEGEKAQEEKRKQMNRVRQYTQAFKEQSINICEESGGSFIPNKKAKHRHPDQPVFPVQGAGTDSTETENIPTTSEQNVTPLGKALGLNDNPPLLAFLQGVKILKCYGCKTKFGPTLREPPNDMIIKIQVKRDRLVNNKWIPGWKKSWAYFHLSISCLKLEKSILEVEDIYIPNDIRDGMNAAHVSKLQRMGWWDKLKMRNK